jgi:hypothetical protein
LIVPRLGRSIAKIARIAKIAGILIAILLKATDMIGKHTVMLPVVKVSVTSLGSNEPNGLSNRSRWFPGKVDTRQILRARL